MYDYSINEETVSKLDFGHLFQTSHPNYKFAYHGGGETSGTLVKVLERDKIYTIKGPKPLKDGWLSQYTRKVEGELVTLGAKVDSCEDLSGINYANNSKDLGPDSSGVRIVFSINGSNGLIHLRYTTIENKNPKSIGYLSVYMIEYR